MKKIAIFQEDLNIGGIQKSLLNFLKSYDRERLSVDLFLFQRGGSWENEIPGDVKLIYLQPLEKKFKYLPFDIALSAADYDFSELEENYDLSVDFNSYQPWCAAAAILCPAEKRVMWVHNDVEIKFKEEWKYRVLFRAMKGKYKYFEGFACVSEAIIEPFKKMSGLYDREFFAIPNCVNTEEIFAGAAEEPDERPEEGCFNLCAVGRLCHQKGYDLMLELAAGVFEKREDMRLYIIGDGPEREGLEKKIPEKKLSGKVFLLGRKENPYSFMKLCDGLVSTSRYEGQGINLLEAKALGLQVFIPKRLEKYVEGIAGSEDLERSLIEAVKKEKITDNLLDYNKKTLAMIEDLC